jgi:hypothetical protein
MSLAKDCGSVVTISNREKTLSVVLTKITQNWKISYELYDILKPNSPNTGK